MSVPMRVILASVRDIALASIGLTALLFGIFLAAMLGWGQLT